MGQQRKLEVEFIINERAKVEESIAKIKRYYRTEVEHELI
jgi:hypothetical protein